MRTYKRMCREDYTLTADNGDTLVLARGKEYMTSAEHDDGTVTVFAAFWARVPVSLFSGAHAQALAETERALTDAVALYTANGQTIRSLERQRADARREAVEEVMRKATHYRRGFVHHVTHESGVYIISADSLRAVLTLSEPPAKEEG